MKKSLPVVLALSGSLVAIGCNRSTDDKPIASNTPSGASTSPSADSAAGRDKALVRVVHAVPGTTAIDVVADDTTVATAVSYGAVTPYKELPATVDNFAIRPSGQATAEPLAKNSESITQGNHYTLVAFPGKNGEPATLQVVTDNFAEPSNGKARLRVIQAAADVDAIDVMARNDDKPLFDDVDFKETTSYQEIDPSVATLELRTGDGKRVLSREVLKMEAGKSYTVVVAGRSTGAPALDAFVIEDRVAAPPTTD